MDDKSLEEILKCTICFDMPASPVNACKNGHIVCGICRDRVRKCQLCQRGLSINFLAERMSRQLELKSDCIFAFSGCVKPILSSVIKKHQEECEFRYVFTLVSFKN
jgi:E3 ubiquitin-protein ligase SIAH1